MKKGTHMKSAGAWLALIVIVVVLGGTHHNFFDVSNIRNVLGTNAELLVVAVGMTVVVISGGIDLSVGAMMAGAQLLLMELHGLPAALAIVIVLAFGFAAGALVNGVLIGIAKLNFFVVTLASMTAGYGIVLVITNGSTTTLNSNLLNQLGNSLVFGIPTPAVIFVVLLVILALVMHRTTLGRAVYSVGGNAEASRLAGIPIPAITVLVYGISGFCGALGGVIDAGRFQAVTPTTGQIPPIALTSMAAVLLGGTALKGGNGGLAGTVAGVLVIGVLQNGVDLLGLSSYWQQVVTGLVLIAAVSLDRFRYLRLGPARRSLGTRLAVSADAESGSPAPVGSEPAGSTYRNGSDQGLPGRRARADRRPRPRLLPAGRGRFAGRGGRGRVRRLPGRLRRTRPGRRSGARLRAGPPAPGRRYPGVPGHRLAGITGARCAQGGGFLPFPRGPGRRFR
jgi:ribose/xylose/arabinose/galactoside ABC-type transport system permease subunit